MKLAIITHAEHIFYREQWYAYAPYVREMNLWTQHVQSVSIVAPQRDVDPGVIELPYAHDTITFYKIPGVSLKSFLNILRSFFYAPYILIKIWLVMYRADHIHLRCPGNIGLLGCLVQIFFPGKKKTAKYAGNWDPNSKQPLSYKFQKWLLSNTFLTRNMQVIVYGEWPGQSGNVKAFFTASYSKNKANTAIARKFHEPYHFIFAGSLVTGKRPVFALQLVHGLIKLGFHCNFDVYGEGLEHEHMASYIHENSLEDHVTLHGNRPSEELERAYQRAHFLILPSKSEGWPKVVAEAMFWGCIPVVTSISCVPWMLDNGNRGVLINAEMKSDLDQLQTLLENPKLLTEMSRKANEWSVQYTLETFETEIQKLL
ncbi:MAG: glycosyltransferase family 1 protein [Flavobacterium sp.]|nr:MAG: glycosyltransferase family 1 protein [Flavobacterium sp.]